jgi:hypothetical protein
MKFFWLVTALAACLAGATLAATLATSSGAPQQAAGAAIALAIAVIPYVFTRTVEGWQEADWRRQMLDEAKRAAKPAAPPAP